MILKIGFRIINRDASPPQHGYMCVTISLLLIVRGSAGICRGAVCEDRGVGVRSCVVMHMRPRPSHSGQISNNAKHKLT